jgi:hypothetical protein
MVGPLVGNGIYPNYYDADMNIAWGIRQYIANNQVGREN